MFEPGSESASPTAAIGDSPTRPRVAVIGAGISGLGAALRLATTCSVVVYEADPRLGGHADTQAVTAGSDGISVDTGFIVFNHRTYPLLTALFDRLNVKTVPTKMSFSVTCSECGLEFAGGSLGQIARSVWRRPATLGLIRGILRFRRRGSKALQHGVPEELTLREWAEQAGVQPHVMAHYLVPLTAAVWSTAPGEALDMPANTTLRFLQNHGLLSGRPPRWRTVAGGSTSYVTAVRDDLLRNGAEIHLDRGVVSIVRGAAGDPIEVTDTRGETRAFDQVVIATHSDQALEMLADPTALEQDILSAVRYTPNTAVLHTDPAPLPSDRRLWAAWNYHLADCAATSGPPQLTYQMNILQHLRTTEDVSVTVNPGPGSVDSARVLTTRAYAHPHYNLAARTSQERVPHLHSMAASTTGTFFCGAWQRWGFHEDGLWSGYRAADALLASLTTPRVGAPGSVRTGHQVHA